MNWLFLRRRQLQQSEHFRRQGWQRFLGGSLAALAVIGFQGLGLLTPLEKFAYFSLFQLRGAQEWDRRIAIVAIDESAIAELNRLSWSREQYAKLLNVLSPAQPRLVILDVLMSNPTAKDSQLVAAMEGGVPIVLAMAWNSQGEVQQAPPKLRDRAVAQGHIIKQEDTDGIVRKIEPEIRATPALGLAATRAYISSSESMIPAETTPYLWINWPGGTEQLPTYAFNDVIERKVNPAVFRDKIVLVGTTAVGIDPLETPFNSKTTASGIHLHAAVIDNLLQKDALQSLSPSQWSGFSLLIYFLGGPILGWCMPSLRWKQQLLGGLGLSLSWSVVSFLSFEANYLLPVVSPILLLSLTTVVTALQDRLMANAKLQEREDQLQQQALYDPLTRLPNRTLFVENLTCATVRAQTDASEAFAVLFLDLDRFKLINARWGHQVGDRLLSEIAKRLLRLCKKSDVMPARFSGDEFALLLRHINSLKDAIDLAQNIEKLFAQPFYLEGHKLFSSVSIGIACSLEPGSCEPLEPSTSPLFDQPESILRNAEIAMYQAKGQGKACYAIFNRDLRQSTIAFLQLESDLRQAVSEPSLSSIGADAVSLEVPRTQERVQSYMEAQDAIIEREFHLHYQPIVSIERGRIVGFEALIRWHHPQRGWISPTEFIPLAEETGSITILGDWVLSKACKQLSRWQAMFPQYKPLTMAVNLSPFQLKQGALTQKIDSVLKETELPSHCLKLEITESGLMANAEVAASLLQDLARLGVQLCIDDFGIGYSSLGRLQHLPFNTLKIDQSFVKRIIVDDESWEIVQTVLSLAHALGMSAIAEGVETAEHLQQLRQLHCDYGQGYHFSRPLDAKGAAALLKADLRW